MRTIVRSLLVVGAALLLLGNAPGQESSGPSPWDGPYAVRYKITSSQNHILESLRRAKAGEEELSDLFRGLYTEGTGKVSGDLTMSVNDGEWLYVTDGVNERFDFQLRAVPVDLENYPERESILRRSHTRVGDVIIVRHYRNGMVDDRFTTVAEGKMFWEDALIYPYFPYFGIKTAMPIAQRRTVGAADIARQKGETIRANQRYADVQLADRLTCTLVTNANGEPKAVSRLMKAPEGNPMGTVTQWDEIEYKQVGGRRVPHTARHSRASHEDGKPLSPRTEDTIEVVEVLFGEEALLAYPVFLPEPAEIRVVDQRTNVSYEREGWGEAEYLAEFLK